MGSVRPSIIAEASMLAARAQHISTIRRTGRLLASLTLPGRPPRLRLRGHHALCWKLPCWAVSPGLVRTLGTYSAGTNTRRFDRRSLRNAIATVSSMKHTEV